MPSLPSTLKMTTAYSLCAAALLTVTASLPGQMVPHSSAADSDIQAKQNGDSISHHHHSWANFTVNTLERSRPGGAFVGANFYLIGGEVDEAIYGVKRASKVEVFDGLTVSWSLTMADMPIPVSNISSSLAVIGDKIYVFGGWTAAPARTDAIQIFDTSSKTWSVHATTMPEAVYGCSALTTDDGRILICGGSVRAGMGYAATDSAYFFDPITGLITPTTAMPEALFLHSADILGKNAFVAAGYGSERSFLKFHTDSESWMVLPDLPSDRAGCGMTAIGDYCVFYGGDWNNYRDDCEVFHFPTASFNAAIAQSLGTMPIGKRSFAYDDYQSPFFQAILAINGWRNYFIENCAALY